MSNTRLLCCLVLTAFLLVTSRFRTANAQTSASNKTEFIQENALEIPQRTAATPSLYRLLRDKQAILIGEMHGTKEPAEFAQGVVETLLSQGHDVVLGIEAISTKADAFIKAGQLDSLRAFWTLLYAGDGRMNASWIELIWRYRQHPHVQIVLFDQTIEQNPLGERDKVMAMNLLGALRKRPGAFLVTLSGNIHNQLKPYRDMSTMGYYLHTLPDSPLKKERMLSVNHFYGAGTMINNRGEGLKLREVSDNSGLLGSAVPYQNYFLQDEEMSMWNAILFSRTVTAAESPERMNR